MSERNEPPRSAGVLTKWVDAFARERGLTSKRVRDWVSYMVLGGQLEKARKAEGGPRFIIKGAVALEMRLPSKARATKDIDFILDGGGNESLTQALREALAGEYQGFTFRVKGPPYVMPNDSVRVEVVLDYKGRSWGTVHVDMSSREGEHRGRTHRTTRSRALRAGDTRSPALPGATLPRRAQGPRNDGPAPE